MSTPSKTFPYLFVIRRISSTQTATRIVQTAGKPGEIGRILMPSIAARQRCIEEILARSSISSYR